ncbi:MAG: YbbR-like domain-containing protein, partial [Polyangiaceae bacterium]|nr:YbbR-like domain-containing protein [Polyangiaceae bacterium]
DAVVSRPIPVQVPLAGQPVRGFAIQGPPATEPAVVLARGPQTLVETLQFVRTEPFDVEGLAAESTLKRKLPLEMPPLRVVFSERSVLATVTVGRARTERVFQKLAVQVVGVVRSTVIPGEVDVRVAGPPDLVEELRPEQVVPIADVHSLAGDARAGSIPVPVTVALDGCSVQVVPPTVVVRW